MKYLVCILGASPPPIRGPHRLAPPADLESASRTIETVKAAIPYILVGPPIVRYGPGGEVHVDVPLMYHDLALDRVHYDPVSRTPSPKGRPVHVRGVRVDVGEVKAVMTAILKEVRVIDAPEFREPEVARVAPLAWRSLIIAHVKVSYVGRELIPDYGLTEEIRRYVV